MIMMAIIVMKMIKMMMVSYNLYVWELKGFNVVKILCHRLQSVPERGSFLSKIKKDQKEFV